MGAVWVLMWESCGRLSLGRHEEGQGRSQALGSTEHKQHAFGDCVRQDQCARLAHCIAIAANSLG